MKPSKIYKCDNPLAKTLVSKGGLSSNEAVKAAGFQIDRVRDRTLKDIDATLDRLHQCAAQISSVEDEALLTELYQQSNRILAVAGFFDLGQLGEAAYCLCELVSGFQSRGWFNKGMIDVHLQGLKMLRQTGELSVAEREQIVSGLRQINDCSAKVAGAVRPPGTPAK